MNRFFLFLALLWIPGIAGGADRPPPRVENRFLFILETSGALKKSAGNSHSLVANLVRSGMEGQMKPGDTFGIWTFNQKINSQRFPVQRWSPSAGAVLQQQVATFLADQKYESEANLDSLLSPLFSVVRNSRALTVILVTEGKRSFDGIPFADEIYQEYQQNYTALRSAQLPFVTALAVREGEIVAYGVSSTVPPWKIPNPPLPLAITNSTPSGGATTNSSLTKNSDIATPAEVKPRPVVSTDQPGPIEPLKASSLPETARPGISEPVSPASTTLSVAPTNSPLTNAIVRQNAPPPAVLPLTNPPPVFTPASASSGTTQAQLAIASYQSNAPGKALNNRPGIESRLRGDLTPERSPIERPQAPSEPVVSTGLITTPPRFATGKILWVIGSLAALLLVFVGLQTRSRVSRPSLITRSMDESRKGK